VSKSYDVLVAGSYSLDLIFTGLPHLPRLGEDLLASGFAMIPGEAYNSAVAMHRLGLKVLMDIVYYHTGPDSVLLQRPGFHLRLPDGRLLRRQLSELPSAAAVFDAVEAFDLLGRRGRTAAPQEGDISEDGCQRVVDLVRDSGHDLTETRQSLRLD